MPGRPESTGMLCDIDDLPDQVVEGIRLFNEGSYFDCHEVIESIWLQAEGSKKDRLQVLILAAVSLHHLGNGNLKGAESVGRRTIAKLALLPERIMGIDVSVFRRDFETYLNAAGAGLPAPRIGWVNR